MRLRLRAARPTTSVPTLMPAGGQLVSSDGRSLMEAMPWSIPIHFNGISGVHKLDDDRRVTVWLAYRGNFTWTGLGAAIASKRTGVEIARTRIEFTSGEVTDFGGGYHWINPEQPPVEAECRAVEAWIALWR